MTENGDAPADLHIPDKTEAIDQVTLYTCLKNCYGNAGQASGCCMLMHRDFIMGPVKDTEAFLMRLKARYGRKYSFDEVFIEYKEGKKLFPDKSCWQNPKNFPALRVKIDSEGRFPCRFLDQNMLCSVHDIKPLMCKQYRCDHLKKIVELL